MARKTRIQTAKDWLVVAFCLFGLIFFVFASANHISQLLSRPISEAKAGPAAGETAKAKPEAASAAASTQGRPTENELATLFSGASSLALIMFSLLLAFAAIIGWQSLRHEVETVKNRAETILEETSKTLEETSKINRLSIKRAQRLEKRLKRRVKNLEENMKTRNEVIEKELRGRVTAVMGLVIGTLHSDPAAKVQTEEDKAYLSEAVYHSKEAHEKLEKIPGNSKYIALNNLVYFSCLLEVKSGRDKLLEQGRELRDIGRKYQGLATAIPYLVTYTRTVLAFSSDEDQIRDALGTIQEVRNTAGLSKLAEREAQFVENSLSEKLSSLAAS